MNKKFNHFLNLILIILFMGCSTTADRQVAAIPNNNDDKQIKSIIESMKAEILSHKIITAKGDEYYDMTAYLNSAYTSMYFLSLIWTNDFYKHEKYWPLALKFKQHLLDTQSTSGGWYRVLDSNLKDPADVSATVINYMFLKALGESTDAAHLVKAKNYILSHGGIEKTDLLTKIFLSLFQNYNWDKILKIPYVIFSKYSPVNANQFASWMPPHLLPLAILRKLEASKSLGNNFSIKELNNAPSNKITFPKAVTNSDQKMILKLMQFQATKGSFGGYVIATIFSRMVLSLVGSHQFAIPKAQKYLDKYFFEVGKSNFLGATQDGHIWDTALLTTALIESGVKESATRIPLEHVIKLQSTNGGYPFGYDLEATPDIDDTAIVLSAASHFYNLNEPFVKKAFTYLKNMQNKNGGFAGFSKNNNGNFILKYFTKPFEDTSDLFDEASPDATGHVLEAYGRYGFTPERSKIIRRAIAYLRKNQTQSGAFYGRWGVNYLYGTSAVIVGLSKIGVSVTDPMVAKAIKWTLSKQNKDGGFGESTLSYSKKEWEGVGISTPSQTAWAIMGLLEYLPADHLAITKAVNFLISNFKRNNNTFVDQSVTGTGHPNAAYIVYPSYAKSFPLIALTRYLKLRSALR